MRLSEQGQFIFNQKPEVENPADNTKLTSEYFTILGEHEFLDENNRPRAKTESKKVLAKKENNKFYVKIGAYNRLLNPMGLFSEGNENKFLARFGKNEWVFKDVNANVFDMYVKFLSTKNLAWLNNAEREMI